MKTLSAITSIVLLALQVHCSERQEPCDTRPQPRVWPSIQAKPVDNEFRLLQINWEVDEVLEDDWVGVFVDDPRTFLPTDVYTAPPTEPTSANKNREIKLAHIPSLNTAFAGFSTNSREGRTFQSHESSQNMSNEEGTDISTLINATSKLNNYTEQISISSTVIPFATTTPSAPSSSSESTTESINISTTDSLSSQRPKHFLESTEETPLRFRVNIRQRYANKMINGKPRFQTRRRRKRKKLRRKPSSVQTTTYANDINTATDELVTMKSTEDTINNLETTYSTSPTTSSNKLLNSVKFHNYNNHGEKVTDNRQTNDGILSSGISTELNRHQFSEINKEHNKNISNSTRIFTQFIETTTKVPTILVEADKEEIIFKNDESEESRFGGGHVKHFDYDRPILSSHNDEENRFGGGIGINTRPKWKVTDDITYVKDPYEEHRFGGYGKDVVSSTSQKVSSPQITTVTTNDYLESITSPTLVSEEILIKKSPVTENYSTDSSNITKGFIQLLKKSLDTVINITTESTVSLDSIIVTEKFSNNSSFKKSTPSVTQINMQNATTEINSDLYYLDQRNSSLYSHEILPDVASKSVKHIPTTTNGYHYVLGEYDYEIDNEDIVIPKTISSTNGLNDWDYSHSDKVSNAQIPETSSKVEVIATENTTNKRQDEMHTTTISSDQPKNEVRETPIIENITEHDIELSTIGSVNHEDVTEIIQIKKRGKKRNSANKKNGKRRDKQRKRNRKNNDSDDEFRNDRPRKKKRHQERTRRAAIQRFDGGKLFDSDSIGIVKDKEVIIFRNDKTEESRFGGGQIGAIDNERPILSTDEVEENRFGGGIGVISRSNATFKENITLVKDPVEEHRFGGGYGKLSTVSIPTTETTKFQTELTTPIDSSDEPISTDDTLSTSPIAFTEDNMDVYTSTVVTSITPKTTQLPQEISNQLKNSSSQFFRGSNSHNNSSDSSGHDNSDVSRRAFKVINKSSSKVKLSIPEDDDNSANELKDLDELELDYFISYTTEENNLMENINIPIEDVDNKTDDEKIQLDDIDQNIDDRMSPSDRDVQHFIHKRNAVDAPKINKYAKEYIERDYVIDFDYGGTWSDREQNNSTTEKSKQKIDGKDTNKSKFNLQAARNRKNRLLTEKTALATLLKTINDTDSFNVPMDDLTSLLYLTGEFVGQHGKFEAVSLSTMLSSANNTENNLNDTDTNVMDEENNSNIISRNLTKLHHELLSAEDADLQIDPLQDGVNRMLDVNDASEQDEIFGWSRYHPWVLYSALPTSTSGRITSTVTQPRPPSERLAVGGCVGYWVAYIRRGRVLAAKCFSAHPTWMWDNRDSLSKLPLQDMALLGTHNAGSVKTSDTWNAVEGWVVCQDEKILDQLLYGIRHLDLRIAYYPDSEEKLWINHEAVKWKPLRNVLQDIVDFTLLSPDAVIVDIHRTPVGFDLPEAKELLLSTLTQYLSKLVYPHDNRRKVTLEDIWAAGRSVLICYGDWDLRDQYPWLWPPIPQAWANTQMVTDLKAYLVDQTRVFSTFSQFWAAMGHLTPTFWDIIFKADLGNRGYTDMSARMLRDFITKSDWVLSGNVIAVDFFHTSYLLESIISINIARSRCPEVLRRQITTTTTTTTTTTLPPVTYNPRVISLTSRPPILIGLGNGGPDIDDDSETWSQFTTMRTSHRPSPNTPYLKIASSFPPVTPNEQFNVFYYDDY